MILLCDFLLLFSIPIEAVVASKITGLLKSGEPETIQNPEAISKTTQNS
jgi:hypothetical protein